MSERPAHELKLEELDRDVLTAFLKQYRIQPHGGLLAAAVRLQTRFELDAASRKIRLARCSRCNGTSDEDLPVCPFCGEEGLTQPGEVVATEEPVRAPTEVEQLPAVDVTAIEPAEHLDRVVSEIGQCARTHRSNIYRVACLLRQIKDHELWRHRYDGTGKPLYNGYLACVEAEVHIKRAYASRLIKCAEEFTEEQFEQWGASRLFFSSRLPPAQREGFLRDTKGVPTSKLGKRANLAKGASTKGAEDEQPELAFPRMKMGKRRVVEAVPLGRVTARLYKRPTTSGTRVGVPTEDVMSLTADCFTHVQITDNLWARMVLRRVADGTGAWGLSFEIRKGKAIGADRRIIDVEKS